MESIRKADWQPQLYQPCIEIIRREKDVYRWSRVCAPLFKQSLLMCCFLPPNCQLVPENQNSHSLKITLESFPTSPEQPCSCSYWQGGCHHNTFFVQLYLLFHLQFCHIFPHVSQNHSQIALKMSAHYHHILYL